MLQMAFFSSIVNNFIKLLINFVYICIAELLKTKVVKVFIENLIVFKSPLVPRAFYPSSFGLIQQLARWEKDFFVNFEL